MRTQIAIIVITLLSAVPGLTATSANQSPATRLMDRLERIEFRVDSMICRSDLSHQDELASVCAEIASLKAALASFAESSHSSAGVDSLLAHLCGEVEKVKTENQALRSQIMSQQFASALSDEVFFTAPSNDRSTVGAQAGGIAVPPAPASDDGLSFSGLFDAAGSFDNNSSRADFMLNQLEGDIEQAFSDRVSFRADVELNSDGATSYEISLEQGFVQFTPSGNDRWQVKVGRFNSPIGFEQSDPLGSYLYTRGFIYDYALPSDLTGFMTTAQLSKRWDISLLAVNGWNRNSDNNTGKSLGLQTGLQLGTNLSAGLSILAGPEQDENNSSIRTIFDGTITLTTSASDYFTLEFHRGTETKALVDDATALWSGVMAAGHYQLINDFSVTARADHFRDRDGNRTGVAQNLTGFAIAPTWSVPSGPDLVLEMRQNWSNQPSFGDSGEKKTQFDVALEVTLGF
ncbi:MAG: porin [Candidatus Zixiibacteriota bacterium]